MLKNLLMAMILIVCAVTITTFLNQNIKTNRGEFFLIEKGKEIPDFSFETLDGQAHYFYDFKGKDVIVHFWASWCAPCVVEFPELISMAKKNKSIVVLAFSSDNTVQAIESFLAKNKMKLPENMMVIHDKDKIITNDKFSVFRLPESFIFDKDLKLENHIIGAYKGWAGK